MGKEKENYKALVDRMVNTPELSKKHPLFGKMSRKDWVFLPMHMQTIT